MKNRFLIAALSAVLLAAGCAKTGLDPVDSAPTYKLVLTGDLDTKTSLAPEADGRRSVLWKAGDMLGLFVQEGGTAMTGAQNILARLEAADENTGAGFSKGSFATSLTLAASTTYNLGIYYPYVSDAGAADAIEHRIPAVQTQPAVSDSRHLGLSGHFSYATASFTTPADLTDYTPTASFTMSHKTSTMLLSVKAAGTYAGWKVKAVKVTAPEGVAIAGDVQYVPSTDSFTLIGNESESIALSVPGGAALSADSAVELYLVAFPAALAGKNLTITYSLEAADASSVKTVTHTKTVSATSKAFAAGRVHHFEEVIPDADSEGWVFSAADAAYDLSANGTANCYIVSAPGKYSFDATVIGNGQKGIMLPTSTTFFHTEDATIAPVGVKLVWQTSKGLITNLSLSGGKVTFSKNADTYGNALIAVTDGTNIIWSWHIWCTDMGDTQTYISDYGTYETMDRNLGATYASANVVSDTGLYNRTVGMFYQWGRKDPFVGPADITAKTGTDGALSRSNTATLTTLYDINGNTVARPSRKAASGLSNNSITYAIQNPMMMLNCAEKTAYDWFSLSTGQSSSGPKYRGYSFWGNPTGFNYKSGSKSVPVKTIYDPCPPGYMVPPTEWQLGIKGVKRVSWSGGQYSADGGSTTTWIPYASQMEAYNSSHRWNGTEYGYYWCSSYVKESSTYTAVFRIRAKSTFFEYTSEKSGNVGYGNNVRCVQELR